MPSPFMQDSYGGLPLAPGDVQTSTLRLPTAQRDIRAGKVILIIGIQHGSHRERAGPRLRGGPHHRDHEILARASPRERSAIVVLGIGERALPGARQLFSRL